MTGFPSMTALPDAGHLLMMIVAGQIRIRGHTSRYDQDCGQERGGERENGAYGLERPLHRQHAVVCLSAWIQRCAWIKRSARSYIYDV